MSIRMGLFARTPFQKTMTVQQSPQLGANGIIAQKPLVAEIDFFSKTQTRFGASAPPPPPPGGNDPNKPKQNFFGRTFADNDYLDNPFNWNSEQGLYQGAGNPADPYDLSNFSLATPAPLSPTPPAIEPSQTKKNRRGEKKGPQAKTGETKQNILKYMQTFPDPTKVTGVEVASHFDITSSAASQHIRALQEDGLLPKTESQKGVKSRPKGKPGEIKDKILKYMQNVPDPTKVTLDQVASHFDITSSAAGQHLTKLQEDGRLATTDSQEKYAHKGKRGETKQQILNFINTFPDPAKVTMGQVASECGITPQVAGKHIRALQTAGLLPTTDSQEKYAHKGKRKKTPEPQDTSKQQKSHQRIRYSAFTPPPVERRGLLEQAWEAYSHHTDSSTREGFDNLYLTDADRAQRERALSILDEIDERAANRQFQQEQYGIAPEQRIEELPDDYVSDPENGGAALVAAKPARPSQAPAPESLPIPSFLKHSKSSHRSKTPKPPSRQKSQTPAPPSSSSTKGLKPPERPQTARPGQTSSSQRHLTTMQPIAEQPTGTSRTSTTRPHGRAQQPQSSTYQQPVSAFGAPPAHDWIEQGGYYYPPGHSNLQPAQSIGYPAFQQQYYQPQAGQPYPLDDDGHPPGTEIRGVHGWLKKRRDGQYGFSRPFTPE